MLFGIGSDFVTVNVVKEAKKLGVYVIVTDLMPTSPTKAEANESWLISTTDVDLLEQKCIEENITAIMFGASDFNIENARVLCKRLNLPIYCDNDGAWKAARDKSVFKEIIATSDIILSALVIQFVYNHLYILCHLTYS